MAYEIPSGDDILISLRESRPTNAGYLLLELEEENVRYAVDYVKPSADNITLEFTRKLADIEKDGGWILLDLQSYVEEEPGVVVTPPTIEDGLPKMRPDVSVPWGAAGTQAEANYSIRWKDAGRLNVAKTVRWIKVNLTNDCFITIPWADLPAAEKKWRIKFARFDVNVDQATTSPFKNSLPAKDDFRTISWDKLATRDGKYQTIWLYPAHKDIEREVPWEDTSKVLDEQKELPWGGINPKDVHHNTKWGDKFYQEICVREYEIPDGLNIHFDLDTKIEDVGDGLNINFYLDSLSYDLRCSHREPSGFRDAYDYIPPTIGPYVPFKKVYTVMNNFLMTRVSDSKPIDVKTATIYTDLGSWCWSIDATIKSEDSFQAIEPDENGNQEIEVVINGYTWRFVVEQASYNEGFVSPSWAISGRGLAAELADPYAAKVSYTEAADRTAIQLIEGQLENTDWTLDFQGTDWLIPGGVFSYQDLCPLKAIQKVAEAAGAVIQSDPVNKILTFLPRYKISPWDWATTTPDLTLNAGVTSRAGMQWKPGAGYNGVFVSGTSAGIVAKVMLEGTSGTSLAPMVTDQLITATEAARERGRKIIAESANWQTGSFTLPLFSSPALPGLIAPGMILEASRNGVGFRTQATANRITANRQNGLVVRQYVEVERYRG